MNKLVPATPKPHKDRAAQKWLQLKDWEDREMWMNDLYTVIVNRGQKTGIPDENGDFLTVTWLSIRRNDRQAKTDWRHMQWIKNQLVGEENEGVEIYPAESRLVDGSNQYHLWVFEDASFRFPFGFTDGRQVAEKPLFGATQRKFPENRKPHDLAEQEAKLQQQYEKLKNQE